jgi:ArsR family transcriptional regulator
MLQSVAVCSIFVKAYILMADKRLDTLETIFKALADRTRLRIIGLLLSGEICVCHIHESLALPQPTVSRHLAYLRNAGLVVARKDGLWVHYQMAPLADPVMQAVIDAVAHALGHLGSAERDRKRLEARAPVASRRWIPLASAPCCGGNR